MTRPKQDAFSLMGINRDQIPGLLNPDWWSNGRNIYFHAGQTVRTAGEVKYAETGRLFPARFVHYIDTGIQSWHLYGGNAGVAVTDGVNHYNITPAGWGPIASKNFNFMAGDINGVPFVNHPERGPYWWDADVTHIMTKLPLWPASWTCRVMRAHKNFLLAANIDTGTGLLESQVSWSTSANPGQIPSDWVPSPTNDAGDYSFATATGPILDLLSVRDQVLVGKQGYMGVLQYVGGQFVFEGRDLFPSCGVFAAGAWVEQGNFVWMIDGSGRAIRHDMTTIEPILHGILEEYLKKQINYEYPSSVFCFRDEFAGQVGFAYPVGSSIPCVEAVTIEPESMRPGIRDLPGVFDWSLGISALVNESWDSDHDPWNSDVTSWNQTASGYQPMALFFAADTRGIAQEGVGNQAIDAASGNLVNMSAFVSRDAMGAYSYERRKTISGLVPRVQGTAGDVLQWQFGQQDKDNAAVELTPLLPFVIGTDDRLDFFMDGRLGSILVQSAGGNPWKLAAILPEMRDSGRW